MQGLKSWAWAPKVLENLLCEGSSAGFLLCKPFCRTFVQNPKCSESAASLASREDRYFPPIVYLKISLCIARPTTVLADKCDIPPLLKDNQIVRDNCLTVQRRWPAGGASLCCHPIATGMSLAPSCFPLCSPNIKSSLVASYRFI